MTTVFEKYPFKWPLWKSIEKSLAHYKKENNKKTIERERWHLREFHSQQKINFLAKILKKKYKNNVCVEVTSTWIDQYPKAIFKVAKNGPILNVELADILLVVSRLTFQGRATHRTAILLQAKCSSSCSVLDNTSDASTTSEKNLIELCEWPIEVKSGATGHSINSAKKDYTLSSHNGFLGHAAYLLIPKSINNNDLPYNLLLPNNRDAQDGIIEHFSDVIHKMIHSKNQLIFGRDLNNPKSEWSILVEDLINYTKTKGTLRRFTAGIKYRKKPISKVINIIHKIAHKNFYFFLSFYKFSIVSDNQPPSNLIINRDESDGGFGVIEVSISSENDEFQFQAENN